MYELDQCLDKKFVLFLQSCRGQLSETGYVLFKRLKRFERPRFQQLISDLTTFRTNSNGNVLNCITKAQDMKLKFPEINDSIGEKCSLLYLWKEFLVSINICTQVKFCQDKSLIEIKRDRITLKVTKISDRNTEKSTSVFFNNNELVSWSMENLQNYVFRNIQNLKTQFKYKYFKSANNLFIALRIASVTSNFIPTQNNLNKKTVWKQVKTKLRKNNMGKWENF